MTYFLISFFVLVKKKRKNLVYDWIILFETVFRAYYSRDKWPVQYLFETVQNFFLSMPVWCDVPCLSKGPYFKGNYLFLYDLRSFPCRLNVGRTDFKFKFTRSETRKREVDKEDRYLQFIRHQLGWLVEAGRKTLLTQQK